ncbi:MAG TPA: hypothetical protein VE713_13605 [Pyrinomonadaceae bacterium]|nr:hypothetical protein [Pyrinomonadaceae bacterium]
MRKTIDLDELIARYGDGADDRSAAFPEPVEINLAHFDDPELVGPDTQRSFTIEDPTFGKLVCLYSPGQAASGTLATNFGRKLNNPAEILLSHNHAMMLLDMKIKQNIYDAMEGLIREVIYETFRNLNGHAFVGDLKDKEWKAAIKKWHSDASGKRMGSRSGPQRDAANFVKRVMRAAPKVKGTMTEQKLADAMRITLRGLLKQMELYRFSWVAVQDMCKKAPEEGRSSKE